MIHQMELYFSGIGDAMRLDGVRGACRGQANAIAERARADYAVTAIAATVRVEDGTQAGAAKRPYSSVISDDIDGEFGTSKTSRRAVLARAGHHRGAT